MTRKSAEPRPQRGYTGPGYKARSAEFTPLQMLEIPDLVYMTTGQVARLFGVSNHLVTKWFDTGLVQGVVLPGTDTRRYFAASVRELAAERGLIPGGPAPRGSAVVAVGFGGEDAAALVQAFSWAVVYNYPPDCESDGAFHAGLAYGRGGLVLLVVSTQVGRAAAGRLVSSAARFLKVQVAVAAEADDYCTYVFRTAGASVLLALPLDPAALAKLSAALLPSPKGRAS